MRLHDTIGAAIFSGGRCGGAGQTEHEVVDVIEVDVTVAVHVTKRARCVGGPVASGPSIDIRYDALPSQARLAVRAKSDATSGHGEFQLN